jgi:hypothetical protein
MNAFGPGSDLSISVNEYTHPVLAIYCYSEQADPKVVKNNFEQGAKICCSSDHKFNE